MKTLLILMLGTAFLGAGCGASASDADTRLDADGSTTAKARSAAAKSAPVVRELTVPQGTLLHLKLTTAVASDTTRVEEPIGAELTEPISIGGRTAIPSGSKVSGVVTAADGAARVKGRARLVLGFTSVNIGGTRYDMKAEPVSQLADATKGEDATKIGVGAGAGAAIGAVLGGKKGAAEGAAVGGGAGTGVVLATKGNEVRFAAGTDVSTRLTAPLTVRAGR
jgi:hypothetical protein